MGWRKFLLLAGILIVVPAFAEETPKWLQEMAQKGGEEKGSATRVAFGAWGIVCVALGGLGLWSRYKKSSVAPSSLKLIERLSLTQKHGVALIECDGKKILCGMGPEGVSLLKDLSFSQLLQDPYSYVEQDGIPEEELQ